MSEKQASNRNSSNFAGYFIFYPRSWRSENQEVYETLLEDDLKARGIGNLPKKEIATIVVGGLRERFWTYRPTRTASKIVLLIGFLLSSLYVALVTWSPGHSWAGFVGPFSNPSILADIIIGASCLASLSNRQRTAKWLAWSSIAISTTIYILGINSHWLGPGPTALLLFVTPPAIAILNEKYSRKHAPVEIL